MPAAKTGAAVTTDRVDFVDEDDAGRARLALLEQVAHARRTDAHEHLHEVGARHREEGTARFTGDGLGEQRLARTRRAHESAPFGSRPPSLVNFCGSFRNSMISCSSTLASSAPATSAKVILGVSPLRSFALLLPNENALLPPDCIWRNRKIQIPMMMIHGSICRISEPIESRGSSTLIATCLARRRSTSFSLFETGNLVEKRLFSRPSIRMRFLNSPMTSGRR
jgi:hypothetical protein